MGIDKDGEGEGEDNVPGLESGAEGAGAAAVGEVRSSTKTGKKHFQLLVTMDEMQVCCDNPSAFAVLLKSR